MKTFKNKNFTKRDYEATNVVACKSIKAPNENWIEADDSVIEKMELNKLWIETSNGNDVHYFGWL